MADPSKPDGDEPIRSSDLPTQVQVGSRAHRDSKGGGRGKAERYVKGQEIGRGGMGSVVEAVDSALGRTVAVKEALATDWDSVRRFEREMKLTAELEHPAIVPVYDRGRGKSGRPFYVMRRLSGQPLSKLIRDSKSLAERLTLVPALLSAVEAVAFAHRRGILHRDLKPSNVLVGDLGEVSVIDWGLAKRIGDQEEIEPDPSQLIDHTDPGSVLGSPGFMAPEQALAEEVDERTDVFALGACLYYLLSGQTPHGNGSSEELLDRAEGPVQPLEEVIDGVPPELVAIVGKALAVEKDARYRDASAFGAELRRFLAGQLVAAYHYTTLQRLKRFLLHHRVAVAIAVLAVILVVAVTTIATRRVIDERDQANAAKAAEVLAREKAEDYAEVLVLNQAASVVESEPAAAVGLLRQLSEDSPRWMEARSIASAAAARGIPWGHQVHSSLVRRLLASQDQKLVVSGDMGGRLVLHNLADKTARELAVIDGLTDFAWLRSEAVVVWAAKKISIVDAHTGEVSLLASNSPVVEFAAAGSGAVVVWTHENGSIDLLTPGATEPVRVPGNGEKNTVVAVSPDGTLASVRNADGLHVRRMSDLLGASLASFSDAENIVFAASSARFVVNTKDLIRDFEIADGKAIEGGRYSAPLGTSAFVGDTLYHLELMGAAVHMLRRGHGLFLMDGARSNAIPSGIGEYRGSLCVATSDGAVRIFHRSGVVELSTGSVSMVRMAVAGEHIVASSNGAVLMWPFEELLPRKLDGPRGTVIAVVADRALISGAREDLEIWWQLLSDGSIVDLGKFMIGSKVGTHSESDWLISIDERRVLRLHKPGAAPEKKASDISVADWFEKNRVVLGTMAGDIAEIDLRLDKVEALGKRKGAITEIDERGHWLLAATENDVWRLNRKSGHAETIGGSYATVAMGNGGTAYLAIDGQLSVWPPQGDVTGLAQIDGTIVSLRMNERGLVATTMDNSVVRIDTSGATPPEVVVARSVSRPMVSPDGEHAMQTVGRTVSVFHMQGGLGWSRQVSGSSKALSDDGRTLVASYKDGLHVWHDDVPDDPASFRRWLNRASNGLVSRTGKLTWPTVR